MCRHPQTGRHSCVPASQQRPRRRRQTKQLSSRYLQPRPTAANGLSQGVQPPPSAAASRSCTRMHLKHPVRSLLNGSSRLNILRAVSALQPDPLVSRPAYVALLSTHTVSCLAHQAVAEAADQRAWPAELTPVSRQRRAPSQQPPEQEAGPAQLAPDKTGAAGPEPEPSCHLQLDLDGDTQAVTGPALSPVGQPEVSCCCCCCCCCYCV